MTIQSPIQDTFLETLKQEKTPVAVFLINGVKLLGRIEDYDAGAVLLRNVSTQIILKHAISTVCSIQTTHIWVTVLSGNFSESLMEDVI